VESVRSLNAWQIPRAIEKEGWLCQSFLAGFPWSVKRGLDGTLVRKQRHGLSSRPLSFVNETNERQPDPPRFSEAGTSFRDKASPPPRVARATLRRQLAWNKMWLKRPAFAASPPRRGILRMACRAEAHASASARVSEGWWPRFVPDVAPTNVSWDRSRKDGETARAVSPGESVSLLQPYRLLGYASLEDNGAVEIRDLDCIRRAERLAIRTHSAAA